MEGRWGPTSVELHDNLVKTKISVKNLENNPPGKWRADGGPMSSFTSETFGFFTSIFSKTRKLKKHTWTMEGRWEKILLNYMRTLCFCFRKLDLWKKLHKNVKTYLRNGGPMRKKSVELHAKLGGLKKSWKKDEIFMILYVFGKIPLTMPGRWDFSEKSILCGLGVCFSKIFLSGVASRCWIKNITVFFCKGSIHSDESCIFRYCRFATV